MSAVQLRGKEWEIVNVEMVGAEPDVGIMSAYVEGYDLQDADGNLWDWYKEQLTSQEEKVVDLALNQLVEDDEPPEPDGECFRGSEAAAYDAESQAQIQRELKR